MIVADVCGVENLNAFRGCPCLRAAYLGTVCSDLTVCMEQRYCISSQTAAGGTPTTQMTWHTYKLRGSSWWSHLLYLPGSASLSVSAVWSEPFTKNGNRWRCLQKIAERHLAEQVQLIEKRRVLESASSVMRPLAQSTHFRFHLASALQLLKTVAKTSRDKTWSPL